MVCTYDEASLRTRRWARRLRIVAAIVTIVAGGLGALATITDFARSCSSMQTPSPPSKPVATRPGLSPGRCPPYHAYKDGRCQDVR